MNFRETAEHIFLSGIRGVLPEKIISDLISLRGSVLKVGYLSYDLEKHRGIYVLGAGKASAALGHYLESVIGNRISGGHIVTKYGFYCKLRKIKVTEAGHPVPDENSFKATSEIVSIADNASENDLVIFIWSGGGSSLLADHPDGSSPSEMMFFNEMLVRCGADIHEINIVRKHLSKVKGGQLIRHIWPASSVTIYLSDVLGDPPDTVASGPTAPDNTTFADALNIVEKYDLINDMPPSLYRFISDGVQGINPDSPKPGDPLFSRSATLLAGNNRMALQAAAIEAESMGLSTFIVTSELNGETHQACSFILDTIHAYRNNYSTKKPVCLLFGGETTVRVTGEGLGGRNQHLALAAANKIQDISGITFLSAGTDGNDGNTEMAGAVADSETVHDALSMNVDPGRYLQEFDSYNFFKTVGGHIFTGPTMTNVMDMAVVIIE
ncbi:MAG: glycerate kinase [Bacteroidales bacterium]|jgi:hydroxypyruvate reductase/glycerate 2-kinase|nr:glycerate kinase [Bacteroidales bacterium]